MTISLKPQLAELINQKVSTGRYSTASDVISEALWLLEERDRIDDEQMQTLRQDIQVGIDQADRGDLISSDEVFSRLRARAGGQSTK